MKNKSIDWTNVNGDIEKLDITDDRAMLDFAKRNKWVECKNGCCLLDPTVPNQTCMNDIPKGSLPKIPRNKK